MSSWIYRVRYYIKETSEETEDCGLVVGKNLAEAMGKVSNGYGEDTILSVSLEWLDESELIRMSEEAIRAVKTSVI